MRDATQLGRLQTVGIRTAIADPVRNRRWEKLAVEERRALRTAQRTTRSASGRALMRRRGELCERSFVHVLDYGGARRTTLRGWENIRKRYLIQAACANLALLLRHGTGVGTLKQSWAASEGALCALIVAIHVLLHHQIEHEDSNRHIQHRFASGASCSSPERCHPLDSGNSTVC